MTDEKEAILANKYFPHDNTGIQFYSMQGRGSYMLAKAGKKEIWLPKDPMHGVSIEKLENGNIRIMIPGWLYQKKLGFFT